MSVGIQTRRVVPLGVRPTGRPARRQQGQNDTTGSVLRCILEKYPAPRGLSREASRLFSAWCRDAPRMRKGVELVVELLRMDVLFLDTERTRETKLCRVALQTGRVEQGKRDTRECRDPF